MFVKKEYRIKDELDCPHFVCMSCSFKGVTQCMFCNNSTRIRGINSLKNLVYKKKEFNAYFKLIAPDYD